MRRVFGKIFVCCTVSTILMFLYMSSKESKKMKTEMFMPQEKTSTELINTMKSNNKDINVFNSEDKTKVNETAVSLKYILQWTSPIKVPFRYMGYGQQGFIDRKCSYTNCFVTSDRNFLGDITKFDVIAFSGHEADRRELPHKRSPHQKYVFASIESADNYPICTNKWDGYFNWTWTFRLDSESKWGYIVIRDSEGKIIGPKKEMHWMKTRDMDPVTEELKSSFRTKLKAAAWFVSNCEPRSQRELFVKAIRKELEKYNLTIDVYGKCGGYECSHREHKKCRKLIEKYYYFYLSFENSFDEDYVTEKLLHALNNNAVPVVYGGANYTRFMPDEIYLNGGEIGAEKLAEKMNELIQDIDKYSEYFKWKKYYKYYLRDEMAETNDYCGFCTLLNNEAKVKETSIYQNFSEWWDPRGRC